MVVYGIMYKVKVPDKNVVSELDNTLRLTKYVLLHCQPSQQFEAVVAFVNSILAKLD